VTGTARHRQVVAGVLAADPALSAGQVETALRVVVTTPAALRALAAALAADPAALKTGAPPVVGRLVTTLVAAGAGSLTEPACGHCRRTGRPLTRSVAGGVCARCRRRELAKPCARCGVTKPVAARDREHRGVCARCADRPQRTCGRCGRVRRIARRAHGDQPDICDGCFRLPTANCTSCGRRRPCSFAGTDRAICASCAPRRTVGCARCGQRRPPTANWPEGPVCDSCYTAALRHRGPCESCHMLRRLVAPAGPAATTCADCAGLPANHVCIDCGVEDKLYERGRCERCALRRRTGALLRTGDGQIPAALLPVHGAIIATRTPRTALNWLRGGAGAPLLADLAAGRLASTHAALDAHPARRAADYLRHVLVAGGALPARDEAVARTEAWVDRLLADVEPAEHRRLLHAYATWRVLRRLRHRSTAAHRPRTPTGYARTQLRVAARFLDWLGHRGVPLADCRQADIDEWLAAGPAGYPVRDFLGWAASHHHGPTLLVPTLGRTAGPAIAADDRWALVARLLHDDAVELTDRVAGAFLLCYGQQLSRIAVMTTAQVSRGHDIVSVRFGTGDITVPEPLAGLLTELIDTGRRYVGVGAPTASPWLFPGHLPGRPISPARLGERLRTLGIRALPGRRATLLQLAAEVPAAVLADLLHLSVGTATRWTRDVGGDWACYAAELARSGGHGT